MRLFLCLAFMAIATGTSRASIDTLRYDDGTYVSVNTARENWEESVIIAADGPCRVERILVYYAGGTGNDVVRLTGDAAEGAIPPTQYCFDYNTLAMATVNVAAPGWISIDVSSQNVIIGGYERIVVQHLVRPGGPQFGQDAGQSAVRSFLYDPVTPNPNFYQIPGIYYRASGDYMVRLVVTRLATEQPVPSLVDVTRSAGLTDAGGNLIKADISSVVDIDADGWDDVVIGASTAFANNGSGTFTRKTLPFGGGATVWADVDNDGRTDAFVAAGFGNDKLWRNDGNWNFTDITKASGIVNNAPTVTPLWADYDADGDLDLFIANGRTEQNGQEVYFQDKLWRNDNGTFVDVTTSSGIAQGERSPFYDTWGASVADANNDGRPDFFVATYRLAPDRLYLNKGDGTFREISATSGVQGNTTTEPGYFGHGMGSDWADIDNDGDQDLAVGNLGHPDSRARYSNPSLIWINDGKSDPNFTSRVAGNGGVKFYEMNAGMCFMDLDHDGYQDLWHGQISYDQFGAGATRRSRLYLNDAGKRFNDITWDAGMSHHGPWTGVRIDFDRDGDLDLLASSGTESVKLYRNDIEKKGASVTLLLRNTKDNAVPRDGSGAHVTVVAGGSRFHRWTVATPVGGRAAQMSTDLHVGVGEATVIDSVIIRWPNGEQQIVTLLAAGATYVIDRAGSVKRLTSVPNLRVPMNGATGLTDKVTLQWDAPLGDTVKVIVATDPALIKVVKNVTTTASTLQLSTVEQGATYFWQVVRTIGEKTYNTPTWSFSVGQPKPDSINALYPFPGLPGVSTAPVMTWNRATYSSLRSFPTTYEVQISRDSTFTAVDRSASGISDTLHAFDSLKGETRYFWRVRGSNGVQPGPWTQARGFTTYGLPPAIALDLPADGATGVAQRPKLQWRRHPWAERYTVELDTTPSFDTPLTRERPDTAFSVTSLRKPQTTYYWRVIGINALGNGTPSPTWSFKTGGTVSVPLDEIPVSAVDTWKAYDVLGRTIAEGSPSVVKQRIESHRGIIIIEQIDERGNRANVYAVMR